MTRRNNERKANGHAGPHNRVNGHALASTERGGVPVQRGQAASDDARGTSAAGAARSVSAPGTDRDACAEVAPPPPNGNVHQSAVRPPEQQDETEPIPGGEFPLPADPGEFVEEVHRRCDLFELWQKLLNSTDPKIQQRAAEKLTEIRYKGAAALADEPQQIIFDMPRPLRD